MLSHDILNNLTVINSKTLHNTTFYLVTNKYNPTGENRFIFVDLSHQTRTQANYVSSLNSVMKEFNCYSLMLLVNAVTPSLTNNLNGRWLLLGAHHDKIIESGYEMYPLLYQNHEDLEYEGPICWVPKLRRMLTINQLYDIINDYNL